MKKLLSLLSLPLLAAGLVACSSDEGTEATPTFESVPESGAEGASADSSAAESRESDSKIKNKDSSDSSSKGKSSKLKERDAEDFRATGFRYENFASWGVKSPDDRVQCSFNETSVGPWCIVKLDNPPIVPKPENPQWEANMVSFEDGAGFFPFGVVDPGDLVPRTRLVKARRLRSTV